METRIWQHKQTIDTQKSTVYDELSQWLPPSNDGLSLSLLFSKVIIGKRRGFPHRHHFYKTL
jgi:hypothetical protein